MADKDILSSKKRKYKELVDN